MTEFQVLENRIVYTDGQQELACITYPEVAPGVVDISHTFVDDSLRGQGIAGQLMERCVAQLRANGLKTRTSCTYAANWFAKHPDQADLLAQE